MPRRSSLLVSLFLLVGACAYESSGTTTSSIVLADDEPVPTGPADIVAIDQRSEGSSVVVESISLPAAGWVVARADDAGSPGPVIGISELQSKGLTAGVTIPFLVPAAEDSIIHLAIHIDVDEDGEFRYEAPDAFIDQIATTAGGEPATATITLTLLPPLGPASALIDPQVSDGTSLLLAGGLLPADGFLGVHADEGGQPGALLAVTDVLPAGDVGEMRVTVDPPLPATGTFWVVAWVDRDEDGVFDPGEDADQMAVTEDGLLAASSAVITVIRREPAALVVNDQEVAETFVIATLEMPAAGFIEILSNVSGAPGNRLAVVAVGAGTADDVAVDMPGGVVNGARLWLRLWVDFDQDGTLSAGDLPALTEVGGEPVEASFVVTT